MWLKIILLLLLIISYFCSRSLMKRIYKKFRSVLKKDEEDYSKLADELKSLADQISNLRVKKKVRIENPYEDDIYYY